MTRDELLDEGFEKALTFDGTYMQKKSCFQYGYVAGAEPREKKIKELEKEVDKVKLKSGYSTYLEDQIKIQELEEENAELKEENKKSNVLIVDIIEAFDSRSYNDDFEMAQAGKEIYELFYGGKDPKEVFHNAEVPKSSRQLLVEAKEIIRKCMGQMFFHDCEYTDTYKMAEAFLKECEK